MESVIDLTATSFQAILAGLAVFTIGYAYNGANNNTLGKTLQSVSRDVILPSLIFSSLAASPTLTWLRLLQQWPLAVLAISTHALSFVFSVGYFHTQRSNKWFIEALTFNNVSSYPLIILQALRLLSTTETGLAHLKWRVLDTTSAVYDRATIYLVLNYLITAGLRCILVYFVPRVFSGETHGAASTETAAEAIDDEHQDDAVYGAAPVNIDGATETSPLLGASSNGNAAPATPSWLGAQKSSALPIVIAATAGMLIGVVKPLQRAVVGDVTESFSPTTAWSIVGYALGLIGVTFAVVDLLGIGAHVRASENNRPDGEPVPPVLGTVLVYAIWRYVVIPAVVIAIVQGFRRIPSVHVYLQDPAFSFVLLIVSVAPPAWPLREMTAFQSAVYFWVYYTAVITAVFLAAAFSITGHGVSSGIDFDLAKALKSALGGGLAGAAAMVVQVCTLMPMRTIMNYQYRYGGTLKGSAQHLWGDGGFVRFYAGFWAAIFQGPLSRFGDTAANAGILALLQAVQWPVLVKTVVASVASACFRMTLTPIDTLKTTQQTKGGKAGLSLLRERVHENGIGSLWWGALATAAATFAGHYPWFGTYNYLSAVLPLPHTVLQKLFRQAFIGFAASVVSDTVSNSLRVVKTYRQVHEKNVGYWTAAKEIVESDGLLALFGRGLPTRLLTNGLQGLLFSVLWKFFMDAFAGK